MRVKINNDTYLLHRVIFKMINGFLPEFIDHIDRNKLNNNINNLRECTSSQNRSNTSKSKNCGTRLTNSGKYRVKICIKGVRKNLGLFETQEEANEVYDKAAKELHGEFYT